MLGGKSANHRKGFTTVAGAPDGNSIISGKSANPRKGFTTLPPLSGTPVYAGWKEC